MRTAANEPRGGAGGVAGRRAGGGTGEGRAGAYGCAVRARAAHTLARGGGAAAGGVAAAGGSRERALAAGAGDRGPRGGGPRRERGAVHADRGGGALRRSR